MRILHISTRLILGGSQENTVLSCEGQARLGHDVHLAFGPIFGPEGSMLERVATFRTPDGRAITSHEIPDLVRPIRPRRDRRALKQLRRLIEIVRPDIVHTHSSKAGILGRFAAWPLHETLTIGVVHTIHGPPFHAHQSRFAFRAYVLAERAAAHRCHAIVSVADAMTHQFLAQRIGRAAQYRTVYSGMETERFLVSSPGESRDEVRRSLHLTPDHFVIGTVSRLAELKGHDDILDALADDLRTHPEWRLLWVGDGWWRSRLEQRLASMSLTDRVIITGLVPPGRVPAFMRAMDVLVHPSYREGLPRTVPQALLCGTAVIASDVDGTGEVCRDGHTGRLVPVGDHAALRSAVRWMAENPAGRAELAARGREECRVKFSAATMVNDLERVYADALKNVGKRA